jgi:hypothetical protein
VRQTHFEVHFKDCVLVLKFYTLKMKGTTFTSSLVAVDFIGTNLTAISLIGDRDLYRSEFEKLSPTKPI